MNVKRYFAKTAREALRMLKDDLGPDAVVLANRAANGGVEILALPAGDVASLQRARSQAQAAASAAAAAAPVARRFLRRRFSCQPFPRSCSTAAGSGTGTGDSARRCAPCS